MKKELLNKVLLSLFVIMAAFSFTSCDDDETQNGWYVAVDEDQSNFDANLKLQNEIYVQLSALNNDFQQTMMTESDAKKHFDVFCTELENRVNASNVVAIGNTYYTVYLTHAISDPNGQSPVYASKTIHYTPKSN